ncbi:chromosome partitioning protein ParB (plasmid) [Paroceanicella profunda]|uniref:Chromosome partitioning protein ParB n=1 Tax=Paroceanicella profunda TaxID=2579971 RepID=A0A5B8G1Q0_9RHOB|nr:ParB N-terminal domain-containing protein [Paroceanicella profunda]QDL93810.1 chromosome partitioning protein ParB [Paroceanicella profunda]
MSSRNRFGFDVPSTPSSAGSTQRNRGSGPMSAAVRDAAENLQESTEAKMEARRRNAAEAREFRAALEDGLVLSRIALEDVRTDDLPRDRLDLDAVASSDEMDELKASILAHGQKEPVELFRKADGSLQLKKGWRRLTALRQIHAHTGDAAFATVLARVVDRSEERAALYIDMVEENAIREDLTFAEMATLAISAAADPGIQESSAEALVGTLYASLHKMKRSYIRAFVQLLTALGDSLKWPKAVSRNLGVEVARRIRDHADLVPDLRGRLAAAKSVDEQTQILLEFGATPEAVPAAPARAKGAGREKYEFHLGSTKVTARKGECRIKDDLDFADIDRDVLEEAVAAFNAVVRSRS